MDSSFLNHIKALCKVATLALNTPEIKKQILPFAKDIFNEHGLTLSDGSQIHWVAPGQLVPASNETHTYLPLSTLNTLQTPASTPATSSSSTPVPSTPDVMESASTESVPLTTATTDAPQTNPPTVTQTTS